MLSILLVLSFLCCIYSLQQTRINRSFKMSLEQSKFINPSIAEKIRQSVQTPTFVYDENTLMSQAKKALAFPNEYGLTVRYAMKASPNKAILQLFSSMGLHFDASSGFEVHRAVKAGIPAEHMSLSSQEFPLDFKELYNR